MENDTFHVPTCHATSNELLIQKHKENIAYWCKQFHQSKFNDKECAVYLYVHCILLIDEIRESEI